MSNIEEAGEAWDLMMILDATASMQRYAASLRQSLPQIISISRLTGCFQSVSVLAYRDYNQPLKELVEFSGWYDPASKSNPDIVDFASKIQTKTSGTGIDWPEAVKTGLAKAYSELHKGRRTIVLLYADAPPHVTPHAGRDPNWRREQKAIGKTDCHMFADWVTGATCLRDRNVQVFSVMDPGMSPGDLSYFNYLSAVTNGICIQLENALASTISMVTISTLLAYLEVAKVGAKDSIGTLKAAIVKYQKLDNLHNLSKEDDEQAAHFFEMKKNITTYSLVDRHRITATALSEHVPKRNIPVQDFAKRYYTDPSYAAIVLEQLEQIIEQDVTAVSLNPVFGTLWRAVCNDRTNPNRETLLAAFGNAVHRIADSNEKSRMTEWLEESYDYTAEVKELIDSVPNAQKFPCVCLDPTLAFSKRQDGNEDGVKQSTPLTRADLLEIGRSCDYKVLRRLSKVLTRLTFIPSEDALPSHLAASDDVQKLPMALASKEHRFEFWKVLLHLIIPGTMLSSRPAAVLAALTMRIGLQPLMPSAEQVLIAWKDKWNDLSVPETFNVSCLNLLLDADSAYQQKHPGESLLKEEDRHLFDLLVSYRMLELNLETTLVAQQGFTPQKTVLPIGPISRCETCGYDRSVTIMGPNQECGICIAQDYESPTERNTYKERRATNDALSWVECFTCQAQYVVYNVEMLNVRPKCHYCRQDANAPAPVVECCHCRNKTIYPEEHRPMDFDPSSFYCIACASRGLNLVDKDTCARAIIAENGSDWLIHDDGVLQPRLENRSVYHIISTVGQEAFSKIQILPETPAEFSIQGKPVMNPVALRKQLEHWVRSRKTESGVCSLCFSSVKKSDLLLACGRRGCHQRIDKPCLESWYGLNRPGQIINVNALSCPFCRRRPTAKILASHGMGVHAVGNLSAAVDHAGEWVYAWCRDCGFAKPFVERVCAQGAPDEVSGWTCEECKSKTGTGIKTRPCPGCGVETEKISGCGHVCCTMCETHWCFFCGVAKRVGEIYPHMSEAHGSYYGDEDEDDDEDEGGEWYDYDLG